MVQQGTIREITENRIVVGSGRSAGCKNCSSSFCSAGDESRFEVRNPKHLQLSAGDSVEIYMSTGKTILAGFMVLVVPLLLFAAGYLVASQLSASKTLSAVAGLAGLGAGFLLSFLTSRRTTKETMPEILSVKPNAFSAIQPG